MRRQWPPAAGGVVRMQLSDLQDASGVSRSDFDDDSVGFELIQNFAMGIWNHRRAYRGARPALGQVFRDQRRGCGDRWVALTQLTGACYYGDATVEDSKVWCRGVTPIFGSQVLGQ